MTALNRTPARLVLEDGTEFHGRSFGADYATFTDAPVGELVFNTSITGYQEILTDPSYRGQTVLLTQPHIGNQGVNVEDEESTRVWASGLVVREACRRASNFRSAGELSDYLVERGIPAIERVDTRMLVRRIRTAGEPRALITTDLTTPIEAIVAHLKSAQHVGDVDHVKAVTTDRPEPWTAGNVSKFSAAPQDVPPADRRPRLVAYDFGAKRNIFRSLVESGFDVTVVPADTPAEGALEHTPDGVFLSNGPGDPAVCAYAVDAVRQIAQKVPVFGICLGHQIVARAFGAPTFKMKFGHHGGNHPVLDRATERVEITSQNHSFAVDAEALPDHLEMTHHNLYDNTCEGLRHKELPVFSVQFHPEAAPGPHDSLHLFVRFRHLLAGTA